MVSLESLALPERARCGNGRGTGGFSRSLLREGGEKIFARHLQGIVPTSIAYRHSKKAL